MPYIIAPTPSPVKTALKRALLVALIAGTGTFTFFNYRYIAANIQFVMNEYFGPLSATIDTQGLPIARSVQFEKFFSSGNTMVLEVPKLRIVVPIIGGTATDTKTILEELKDGVVHIPKTPFPGDTGASVILGHSSADPWYLGDYGSAFALLETMRTGDDIIVHYRDGRTLTFRVIDSFTYSQRGDDAQDAARFEKSSRPSIILVSCWPFGTNFKRLGVKAVLR